jgi:hypothetical protein
LQLKRWEDQLAKRVLGLPGVIMTDVDDARNLVLVWVENSKARARVEREVEKLDIPAEAVKIERRGPIVPLNSLRDRHREPLAGGLLIEDSGGGFCTLGFLAERGQVGSEDVEGFVTNSHCSEKLFAPDNTVYGQPFFNDPNFPSPIPTNIGTETADPQGFRCGRFLNLVARCRRSDSSFQTLNQGVPENGLGYIARPTVLNTEGVLCDRQGGEPRFCAWNGETTFRIIAESRPIVGTFVDKVGIRTGWTTGVVTGINSKVKPTVFRTAKLNQWRVDFGMGNARETAVLLSPIH